jgi:hypothetical protein
LSSGTLNFQDSLVAYDDVLHRLQGGHFQIFSSAKLRFDHADVQTIGAGTVVLLQGAGSVIQDALNTSNDGLRHLSTIAAGGELQVFRDLSVPNDMTVEGTLTVGGSDHLTLTAGTLNVASGGLLIGEGTVVGPVSNAGIVSPGVASGAIDDLEIDGDYTQQDGGLLAIDVAETSNGAFDRLFVISGHEATLDGMVAITNVNGFTPADGDQLSDVLDYGSKLGQFDLVSWSVPPGLVASAVYGPTQANVVVGPLQSPTLTKPSAAFQNKGTKFPVTWTAVSGTGVKYDVRMKSAPASFGTFSSFSTIKTGLTATTFQFQGAQGNTYCFGVRASKGATHSAFSNTKCTAVPFDDRSVARDGDWQAKKAFGYYLNTFLVTKTHNDTLTKDGMHAAAVAVLATKCPTCGVISVTFGGTTKSFDLHAATTKRKVVFIVDVGTVHTGTVTIKVTSTNETVQIDGLGVSAL